MMSAGRALLVLVRPSGIIEHGRKGKRRAISMKILERSKSIGIRAVNSLLDPVERVFAPRKSAFAFPPVFIIGAPRSGSTLLFQTLVNAYRFGYLSNLHCLCYGFPYLLQVLVGRRLPDVNSSYTSTYGYIEGLSSPSECGEFWYRWFRRRPQYIPLEEIDLAGLRSLRQVLIGLTDTFGLPLLFKNMPCALRLQPLSAILPEARFLFVRRHALWTAQSILFARLQVHGNKATWWSMEPPNVESLRNLPPEEQAVRQIAAIHELIDRDRRTIGEERFLEISFEDFCRNVHETLEQVAHFLQQGSVGLTPRSSVPETFPVSQTVGLPQDEFQKLQSVAEAICPNGRCI